MSHRPLPVTGLCLALAFLMAGCGNPDTPPAITPPSPAVPVVGPAPSGVTASVKVVPARTSDLGFVISAPVKEIDVAEGESVQQGQPLIVLDAAGLSYATDAASAALKSAEANEFIQSQGRRKWNGYKFVWMAGPPEQRQLAHARVLQAQASLVEAQARLAQATLTAPYDGTVVSIGVSRGELVQPGEVVLVMADLGNLGLETTDLSERDIAAVRAGQRAIIRLEAIADPLKGTVSAIDPRASTSPDGDIVYKVTLDLDQQPAQLLWGMTGTIDIPLAN
jgi:multidrug efflux pump subunit AcrA (membrane-fusion protein)